MFRKDFYEQFGEKDAGLINQTENSTELFETFTLLELNREFTCQAGF